MTAGQGSMHEVRVERFATGGEAVGRMEDGRVVFVRDAVPGEVVQVEVIEERRRWARASLIAVVAASDDRRARPCLHAAQRQCGGCDWMHVERDAQRRHKTAIVADQLTRLGGVEEPEVTHRPEPGGPRTTVRCAVTDGAAGFRARRSNEAFDAASCMAAHPDLEPLIVAGRYGTSTEVTLRIGAATGERLVVVDGPAAEVDVPDDVVVCGPGSVDAHHHEVVAGHRFRVSADSFFQSSHAGAESLVAAVSDGAADVDGPAVDLYCGVGLFSATVAGDRLVAAVESSASAVADASMNLGSPGKIVHQRVERWRPVAASLVIADPPRAGLKADGVANVNATGANRLVLVSCDPAAMGRDTGLLVGSGWRHVRTEVIDLFTDTSRIEAVSTFAR